MLFSTFSIFYLGHRLIGFSNISLCIKKGHHYRVIQDSGIWLLQNTGKPSNTYECLNCHKRISEKKLIKNKKYKSC